MTVPERGGNPGAGALPSLTERILATLTRHGSCRCPQCYSLAEHMGELTGKDYGLAEAPGHPLGPALRNVCDHTMTCRCDRCSAQRALLAQVGSRDRPQPWEPVAA